MEHPKCPINDDSSSSNTSFKEAQLEGFVMLPESGSHCKFSASFSKQGHSPQMSTRTQDRNRAFKDLNYAQRNTLLSATVDGMTPALILVQTFSVSAFLQVPTLTSQPISQTAHSQHSLSKQCQYFLYTAIMSDLKRQCGIFFICQAFL